jgi:hypothetical protein
MVGIPETGNSKNDKMMNHHLLRIRITIRHFCDGTLARAYFGL